jgi:hypothetical protein
MWIILNDAFLSVIEWEDRGKAGTQVPKRLKNSDVPVRDLLLVRARDANDLVVAFKPSIPDVDVLLTGGDYAARCIVTRDELKAVVDERIDGIHYHNFKSSVKDQNRHNIYMSVWSALHRLTPYKKSKKTKKSTDYSDYEYDSTGRIVPRQPVDHTSSPWERERARREKLDRETTPDQKRLTYLESIKSAHLKFSKEEKEDYERLTVLKNAGWPSKVRPVVERELNDMELDEDEFVVSLLMDVDIVDPDFIEANKALVDKALYSWDSLDELEKNTIRAALGLEVE